MCQHGELNVGISFLNWCREEYLRADEASLKPQLWSISYFSLSRTNVSLKEKVQVRGLLVISKSPSADVDPKARRSEGSKTLKDEFAIYKGSIPKAEMLPFGGYIGCNK